MPIEKSPRQIAAVPDEAKALEQDAARRPAIERERALLGLEPRFETTSPVETVGGLSLADQPEPESIYASEFASMAKIMEEILEGNKRNHVSQGQSPSHVDRAEPEIARPRPVPNANGALPGGALGGESSMGGRSGVKAPGLAKSRWITPGQGDTTQLPSPTTVQRTQDTAPGLNGIRTPRESSKDPLLGQPGGAPPSRLSAPAETPGRTTARPVVAANGRARDREEPSSLPAGQSWW